MSLDSLSGSTASLDYPEVRPTLDLNFARTKTLDPRMTFTRSSGGTYVGSDGLIKIAGVNTPRFDHDPVTGESLGLMIEEGRTNYILNSTNLYNSCFETSGSGVDEDGSFVNYQDGSTKGYQGSVAPTGETSVRLKTPINYTTNNGYSKQRTFFNVNFPANTSCIASIFYKNDVRNPITSIIFWGQNTGGPNQGTAVTVDLTTSPGVNYGNGWYRLSVNLGTSPSTNNFNFFSLLVFSNHPNNRYCEFAGFQVEAGSFITSYIPTAASSIARAGESASITGTALTSLYNSSEGTLFCRFRNYGYGNAFHAGGGGVSFGNNQFQRNFMSLNMRRDGPFYRNGALVIYNDVQIQDGAGTAGPSNNINDTVNYYNFIGSYSASTRSFTYNGITPGVSIGNYTLPIISRFNISTNSNYFYDNFTGYISRFTYWPKQLSTKMLQTLTQQ
jgi:hypothetical protein